MTVILSGKVIRIPELNYNDSKDVPPPMEELVIQIQQKILIFFSQFFKMINKAIQALSFHNIFCGFTKTYKQNSEKTFPCQNSL